MAGSMSHGKMYHPVKFRELTGSRRPPKYDPDDTLVSALRHAKHKTGLGYRRDIGNPSGSPYRATDLHGRPDGQSPGPAGSRYL